MSRRLACLVALSLWLAGSPPAGAITLDEIILLSKTGVSAEIVIQNLRRDPARPKVTPADVERLRRAGVPEAVITFLTSGAATRRSSASGGATTRRHQRDEARKREAQRLRLEAERLRLEAKRLAAAARQARARSQTLQGRVKAELGAAYDALRRGKDWVAMARFHRFLRGGLVQPNSYAYLEATYGLARAFLQRKMVHSAALQLVEVLRRGPKTPRFDASVTLLSRVMEQIDFVHPVLALLAEFEGEVKGRPRAWLDEYHYLLGEFYERYDNAKQAIHHFSGVSEKSRRRAAAQYHLGVLYTGRKKPRTGVRHFRQALRVAQAAGNRAVAELADLALARLAFEVGSYRAAMHFYRAVPRRSRYFARAQYELAWTQVMSEKYRAALGTIHGLGAPFYRHWLLPDLRVLEAATYLNLCRYRPAQAALKRFATRVLPGVDRVRKALEGRLGPKGLTRAVLRLAAHRPSPLPPLALRALLADVRVYRSFRTLQALQGAQRRAAAHLHGPVRKDVLEDLSRREKAYRLRLGLEIRRRLRNL